jgi:alpha-L-rhamnosidase
MILRTLFFFTIVGLVLSAEAAASFKPVDLTCEYTETPFFIDDPRPRFSWNFTSNERNVYQSAFEIIVSKNLKDVENGRGTVWDSGNSLSSQSVHVTYAGLPLEPLSRYYWAVRCYDSKGQVSDWSKPTWFETAMFSETDWTAAWIGDGSRPPAFDKDAFGIDRMPLFRKSFSASKPLSKARLYIVGLGYYEAYVNGKKVTDAVLEPGWTTYDKQVLHNVLDVTALIQARENVLGVMLGSGWWNPLPIKLFGRWDIRQYQQTGRPVLRAELHLAFTDGTTQIIKTDETWLTAPGPVYKNSVYLGEHYNANFEEPNWNRVGKISAQWKNALLVQGPNGALSAQRQPPIRIGKIVKPVGIREVGKDTFLVDMGQNFAGVARIRVRGSKGKKVTLRYGENVFNDNRLNYHTTVMTQIRKGGIPAGEGAPETAWQEDSYTLKGAGVETWSPRFTFHGFRYVEVTGWPGTPTVDDIDGLVMHSDVMPAGEFSCSNPLLNRIQEITQRTFLSNLFSVQSDCPAREKLGYGADIVVTADAFIYNYDMANFYKKTVRDFANDQQPDGAMTEMSPFVGIADRGYGGNSGPLGWQLAFPYLLKQLYDYYGDRQVIEINYRSLMRQIDFIEKNTINGLYHWDIGDHEALDPRAEAFSANCFYLHHLEIAKYLAEVSGKKDDADRIAKRLAELRKLIVRKYYVPNTGRFDNATQAAQIFALWYKLAPHEENSLAVLKQEFARHNNHVSSGIYGAKMMFDVLAER